MFNNCLYYQWYDMIWYRITSAVTEKQFFAIQFRHIQNLNWDSKSVNEFFHPVGSRETRLFSVQTPGTCFSKDHFPVPMSRWAGNRFLLAKCRFTILSSKKAWLSLMKTTKGLRKKENKTHHKGPWKTRNNIKRIIWHFTLRNKAAEGSCIFINILL